MYKAHSALYEEMRAVAQLYKNQKIQIAGKDFLWFLKNSIPKSTVL